MRIDKWLWCMRLFKTRTKASEACTENRILINSQLVKPSHTVKVNDKVQIKRTGLTQQIEVLALSESRLSAKLVSGFYKDNTPPEDIEACKARMSRSSPYRQQGTGRPTKKERRSMDDFLSAVDDLFE